jgi:hypothetical protein
LINTYAGLRSRNFTNVVESNFQNPGAVGEELPICNLPFRLAGQSPTAVSVAVFVKGTPTKADKFRDGIPTWAGIEG